ncbi:hypothetical protein BOX15_Mlig012517g3 [Macrostomum lignano]|uniref:Uncharacterized protein n=1 Tax=Macrostomum lignano TaxID=282301 RepID=A0A267H180_9PLAT|nr:hypothetical protein BOX15_Mlig012517g3 [Macrostomum lignano]
MSKISLLLLLSCAAVLALAADCEGTPVTIRSVAQHLERLHHRQRPHRSIGWGKRRYGGEPAADYAGYSQWEIRPIFAERPPPETKRASSLTTPERDAISALP